MAVDRRGHRRYRVVPVKTQITAAARPLPDGIALRVFLFLVVVISILPR
jgi:hypothetical protein